eukprot:TRINITY_DN929_c0_g2_i1.p1 TRINITY_DN929_c0_g2~~TRINITY_DN929_c0_g2_i1.p1  ORF type:complete len:339 (-),score=80.42 TRINITY_DN929_c0_g2_i1:167-1183(-)
MESTLPKTRRAYCYNPETKTCSWEVIDVPALLDNQMLVKVTAASVHPTDIAMSLGVPLMNFGQGPGPHILGTEGTGVVIATAGIIASQYQGRKVVMMPAGKVGIWTDYAVVHVNDTILLENSVTDAEGALAMNIPLTAIMMLDLTQRFAAKSVVLSGASPPACRAIRRLLAKNGIEVICIVRKQEKAEELKGEGANHVLVIGEKDFDQRLHELSFQLGVGVVLDCIGGELMTKLAALTPPGTTLCLFGSLSDSPVSVILNDDLSDGKILTAANVYTFWSLADSTAKHLYSELVNQELKTSLRTRVIAEISFERAEEAIKIHNDNKKEKSIDGKVVLKW